MPRPLDIWPADDGAGCQLPFQSKTSVCLCSCAITTWFSNSLVRSGSYTFHWMLLSSSSLQKRSNQLDLVISTLVLLLGRVDMPARVGWGVAPRYYGGSSSTRLGRYNRLEGKLHQSATWCDLTT